MNKNEWTKKLSKELKSLPADERRTVLEYYDELFADRIDDGQKEYDIIASLGDPKAAAEKILSDYDAYLKRGDEPEIEQAASADGIREGDDERGFETEPDIPDKTYDDEPADRAGAAADEGDCDVYTTDDNSRYAKVRKLKIDVNTPEVIIRRARKFALKLPQSDDVRFDVDVGGETMYIKERARSVGAVFKNFFGFGNNTIKVYIELPALESVTCRAVKNGCTLSGFSLRRATLETVGGDIAVTSCDSDYLSLTATGGDVAVKGGLHDSVSVSASSGDIQMIDLSADSLSLTAVGGDITIKDVSVKDRTRLSSVGGDITAKSFEGGNTECKTVSGDITLACVGDIDDYCAIAKTLMGKNRLPSMLKETGAKRKLSLSSVSGNIDVSFDK